MANNHPPNGWKPGQSGNPNGRPRHGNTFTDAIRAKGTPEELAEILWKAARAGEPWAIQTIYNRLEPQATKFSISTETNSDEYNLSQLSDTELERFIELAARARTTVPALPANGEGETPLS